MGDGEGASRGDLALEHGDDAAVAAQHVAEAHGGEKMVFDVRARSTA